MWHSGGSFRLSVVNLQTLGESVARQSPQYSDDQDLLDQDLLDQDLPDQDLPLHDLPLHDLPLHDLPLHDLPDQDASDQLLPLHAFCSHLVVDQDVPLHDLLDHDEPLHDLPFHMPPDQDLPLQDFAAHDSASQGLPKMSTSPPNTTPSSEILAEPRAASSEPKPVDVWWFCTACGVGALRALFRSIIPAPWHASGAPGSW